MSDRKLIGRMKWELDLDPLLDMSLSVEDFLEKIQESIDKVETAMIKDRKDFYDPDLPDLVFRIETRSAGWDGGIEFLVAGYAKETDEEYARRIAKEKKAEEAKLARKQKAAIRAKEKAKKLEADEKAQYEKLKAKYG